MKQFYDCRVVTLASSVDNNDLPIRGIGGVCVRAFLPLVQQSCESRSQYKDSNIADPRRR